VDLLLVIIGLFSLGVRAETLQVNSDGKYPFLSGGGGQFGPKFHVEGDVPHQPFFVSEN